MRFTLARLLGAYVALLLLSCLVVWHRVSLRAPSSPVVIASVWADGKLMSRATVPAVGRRTAEIDGALAAIQASKRQIVYEVVEGESPILTRPEAVFSLSLVPGMDGIVTTLGGRTAYVTPDDLLLLQAYDHGIDLKPLGLLAGADVPVIVALLAKRLQTSAREIVEHADTKRIRVARVVASVASDRYSEAPSLSSAPATRVTGETLTHAIARDAALDAARYLARGVDDDGRFRYMVDAPRNRSLPGYDWPRHAGATYFLAQAAALSHDADLGYATLRAAALLRDRALKDCGDNRCVAQETIAEIGSSALAIIAFTEIARTGLDASYRPIIADLTRFLRSQQRQDGEFMHQYDREARQPVDIQLPYFSGEAALALARAHAMDADAGNLDAARRALAHLVGPGWRFFGNRYYFGEEHWTCQVMAELWRSAPNRDAFDFCLRWQRFGRRLQHREGDSPQDADGALGIEPVITPRLTPVASRCEAAVATLDVAMHGGNATDEEQRALDLQIRRALAFIVRHQFRPGPAHIFADPSAVQGAIPGSPVDYQLRIDYAQHAGSAMIRWLEVATPP